MRAHLVRIGNSQGVRLPKAIIEEAGLGRDLDVAVESGAVVIRGAQARAGWAVDAQACHDAGEDGLADWDAAVDDGEWR
jgi:antitoxin MazE